MSPDRMHNNYNDNPEAVHISPPDYYDLEDKKETKKKGSVGIGSIIDNLLERAKAILSRFLGREIGNDDIFLLGLILVLFFEKKNKEKDKKQEKDDDLEILLMVLIYLFIS